MRRSRLAEARKGNHWSQEHLAHLVGVETSTYRGWEYGTSSPRDSSYRPLAKALGVDLEDLDNDILLRDHEREQKMRADSVADVDRREFLTGTAALATAGAMQAPGRRLGASDVARLRARIQELQALDDQQGGAVALGQAFDHLQQVRRLMHTAAYSGTVGRDLRVLAGEITDMAGWLAYDAGQHDTARRLWTEALCAAQLTENDRLTVLVMTDMSIQATSHGNPREAVELTQAAQRAARPFATPRLLSLLSAREARAHALLGDAKKCHATLWQAEQLLDEGQHPDDQEWLGFWGVADFFHHVALAHTGLGALREAEQARRAALDAVDPAYPRNESLYIVGLAESLIEQGQLDEGAAFASEALRRLPQVSSGRLRSDLRALRPQLAAGSGVPAVEDCLGELTAALP